MAEGPTFFGRLLCRLHGQVPADTLEAYRRASLAVFDLLDQVETRRGECQKEGVNAWTLPRGTQAEMLCAWNAYVLQNLGNQFIDADYCGDPATRGYVPPVTADQVLAFYGQVEGWLNRAQQAHSNPDYRLDVAVPAELPPWSQVEPCPNAHLHGMLEAMRSVREHAALAMSFLEATGAPAGKSEQAQLNKIRQTHAAATTKARYAEDLHGSNPTPEIHERVEPHVKGAIEHFYLLGQLIAMPHLANDAEVRQPASPAAGTGRRDPLPGDAYFDPWRLTEPGSREHWKRDPQAQRAIQQLWALDPDPRQTLAIQTQIEVALDRGDIVFASDRYGKRLGHFFCCPWGPVYQVVRPVTLAGKRLRAMEQFVFDVSAEGVNLGEKFTREIMTGNFHPTTRSEYGDPNEPPDH